ncbi:Hypothetical predicted protein, partial [Paramuricea clavata]
MFWWTGREIIQKSVKLNRYVHKETEKLFFKFRFKMPVTTRRQAAASKSNVINKKANTKTMEPDSDSWDIPETNLKSSIIKTYSKKNPFRTYWTSQSKKLKTNTQDSHGELSKPAADSSVKPPRTKRSQGSLTKTTPASIRKAPPTAAKNSTQTPSIISTTSMTNVSTLRRTRNQTRLAVESMTACTMLAAKPSDGNLTVQDMSLCSMVQVGIVDLDDKMIRNSTVLADCHNMNQDFVPNDISAIEGQNELQDTVVSNYSERTPESQPIQTAAKSVKKVRFDVSEKTPKNQTNQPSAKRNIFRKTPFKNEKRKLDTDRKCPKTSSPDPNKYVSMLHCEISTLLIDDYPNKKRSRNTRSNQMTQDTEKLLDFEPLPLQCSENVGENPRDITPETCNSVKAQTNSAKRRRRLCYHPEEEEIQACVLLDHSASKTKKKS